MLNVLTPDVTCGSVLRVIVKTVTVSVYDASDDDA